jgi:hypothetical protein
VTRCQPLILTPYFDNELADDARSQVEEHLRSCPTCGAILDEVSVAAQRVQDLGRASIPHTELVGAATTFSERARLVPPHAVAVVDPQWEKPEWEEATTDATVEAAAPAFEMLEAERIALELEPPGPEAAPAAPPPMLAVEMPTAPALETSTEVPTEPESVLSEPESVLSEPESVPLEPDFDVPTDDLQAHFPQTPALRFPPLPEPAEIPPPLAEAEPEEGAADVGEEAWTIAWTGANRTPEDGPLPHEPITIPSAPAEDDAAEAPVVSAPEAAPTAAFWEGMRALEQDVPAEPVVLNSSAIEAPEDKAPLTATAWAAVLQAGQAVARVAVIGWSAVLRAAVIGWSAALRAGSAAALFAGALMTGIRSRLRRDSQSLPRPEPQVATAWETPAPFGERTTLERTGQALRTQLAGATVWRRGPNISLTAVAVVVLVVLAISVTVVLGRSHRNVHPSVTGGTAASQTIVPTSNPSPAISPVASPVAQQALSNVITIGSGGTGYHVTRIRSGVPAAGIYRLVFELDGSGALPTAQLGRNADGKEELTATGINVDPSVVAAYSPGGPITAVAQTGPSGMNIRISLSQPQSHSLSYLPAGSGLPARLYIDFSK